ncbi:hypothetical protein FGB62_330g07 [Gracilaria domingensis]|nr:hypothetical protein FGB62_330g07 [Gracilaria domingensis]
MSLTPDELQVANAAIKVTKLLHRDPERISTLELLAFNNVKGQQIPQNIWDRTFLEESARRYLADEKLARTCTGERWESLSARARINLLHSVCNAEGDVTYFDPDSGYTVFTFYAHLKRGNCCGVKATSDGYERTHRCRHCPYTDDGRIESTKIDALKKRIPVIDYVRAKVSEDYDSMQFLQLSKDHVQESGLSEQVSAELENNFGIFASHPLSKRVQIKIPEGESYECEECRDVKLVTCKRCNGYTFLIAPEFQKCPQCRARGYHPCMNCTTFRPPQRKSFFS